LTPTVDDRVLHFEARGLYDGVSLLRDRETGSLWHHITGECLYGRLAGRKLPVSNLLHTTVAAALETDPAIAVAISERPVRAPNRWAALAAEVPILSDLFRRTMAREGARRPTMDVGLGVWTDTAARYYPLEEVRVAGNTLFDRFGGRRLVVSFDRKAHALAARYSDATGPGGAVERPLQVFTRWYGFALTFPGTDVYRR